MIETSHGKEKVKNSCSTQGRGKAVGGEVDEGAAEVCRVRKEEADIGCGGGLFAEEFARLGAQVIGVDPSAASLATARSHAAAAGLRIDYREG